MNRPRSVSRGEWLAARKAYLRNEKALTRMRDHDEHEEERTAG